MPRIPVIDRFRGDNEQSFSTWILMFEAQMNALGTADDKKRETLSCCLEKAAFSTATTATVANNDNELRQALQERYSGDEYKCALELKLRHLKFNPGTRINSFVHELKSVIRELYNITDTTAVDLLAQNHVLARLDLNTRTGENFATDRYL